MPNTKIAILNSRQGLYPCRLHEWVQQTIKTLQSHQKTQTTIVSSIGMTTWDIVTIIASKLQMHIELHVHQKRNESLQKIANDIIKTYNLNHLLVSFVYIQENSNKDFQTTRDISILSSAEKLFPISIRPKGNLEKLILLHKNKIENSYKTQFKKINKKISYSLTNINLNPDIENLDEDYIIHWTKTSKGKWYYESQYDYYQDILQSDIYPRTAYNNLINIIKQNRIYATPTHMPQNIPTVSFTSLSPTEMIPLFKWRSRYQEMSFEPYGIGIKREVADSKKIQEVLYYDNKDILPPLMKDIWLTQSRGVHTEWEREHEYRHLGNFNIENINKQNIILFTRYKKEADQLKKLTGYKTISFEI